MPKYCKVKNSSTSCHQIVKSETGGCYEHVVIGLSLAAILLSIIVFIFGVAVMYFHVGLLGDKFKSFANPPIACVPCLSLVTEHISGQNLLMEKLDNMTDGNVSMCCAHDEDQMSALLKMSMRKTSFFKKPPSAEMELGKSNFSLALAHKLLHIPPEASQKCVLAEVKNDTSSRELLKGVSVSGKGLKIETEGTYFIYSSIHFDSGQFYSEHYKHNWTHEVKVNGRVSLNTTCGISFLSGTFELSEGSVIQVFVCGKVKLHSEQSFVGLVFLDRSGP